MLVELVHPVLVHSSKSANGSQFSDTTTIRYEDSTGPLPIPEPMSEEHLNRLQLHQKVSKLGELDSENVLVRRT